MAVPRPLLDHIIVLVPASSITPPYPPGLTDNFTVIPGGAHADGRTFNVLVSLFDGIYIELIAFTPGISEAERKAHWWGPEKDGRVVDWCLTLPPLVATNGDGAQEGERKFPDMQKIVGDVSAVVRYADPVEGGRRRPDGTELGWAVSFPERITADGAGGSTAEQSVRGEVPFWCFDRTPRTLRVPEAGGSADHQKQTYHPCGAIGVKELVVRVPPSTAVPSDSSLVGFDWLFDVYDAVFGSREGVNDQLAGSREASWPMGVPREEAMTAGGSRPRVRLVEDPALLDSGERVNICLVLRTVGKDGTDSERVWDFFG